MLVVKIIENNTMYSVQELHLYTFSTELHSAELRSMELYSAIFTSSIIPVQPATNLSTNFFSCTYIFHSLNTHQHCMIYRIHTRNYYDSK